MKFFNTFNCILLMRIYHLITILSLCGILLALPVSGAEKSASDSNSRSLETNSKAVAAADPVYKSVIVKSARQRSLRRALPFSVRVGRAITKAEDYLVPIWSPDGQYILLTKAKYHGLYLLTLADGSIRTLSVADRVGYAARWSSDSRFIIVGEAQEIRVINLAGKEVAPETLPFDLEPEPLFLKNDAIYLKDTQHGTTVKISQDEGIFFMPRLSPDKKRVAYIGLSTGIHIRDLLSGKLVSICLGTDMQWMPDSQGIIYTHTQDDGHQITASDLYYAAADGQTIVNLTNTPQIFENHPDIGRELIYVVAGQVFMSTLNYQDH